MAASFIQLLPNDLSKKNPNLTGSGLDPVSTGDIPKYDHIRRPVRGMVLKEETWVTLEVKTRDGKNVPLVDAGGSIEKGDVSYTLLYSNFFIQSISEQSVEKSQVIETFGPAFVFFFGQRPRMINVSGVLLNGADFNWRQEWWANYETHLRGTQCVSNNTKIYISYEDFVIVGYMMSSSTEQVADPNEYIPFSFQMIVSSIINTGVIGENNFPYYTPVNIEPDVVVIQNSEAPQISPEGADVGMFESFIQRSLRGDYSIDFLYGPRAQFWSNYVVQYITGANIRVPVGITGSFVFDQDKTPKYIYGTFLGYKSTPVKYGKIKENIDEYIAKNKGGGNPGTVTTYTQDVLTQQYTEGKKQDEVAKQRLKELGIDITPPNRLKQLAAVGAFATLNLAGNLTRQLLPTDPLAGGIINGAKNNGIADRGDRL